MSALPGALVVSTTLLAPAFTKLNCFSLALHPSVVPTISSLQLLEFFLATSSEGSSSKSPGRFPSVIVSRTAYEIVQDLEAAWCRFNAAPVNNAEAVGNAYAGLCQRRKELYEFIEQAEGPLERGADVVILRFN